MKIIYPILGYAPGYYSNKCVNCKEEFMGDKLARQCEPCAINSLNKSHTAALKRISELEAEIDNLKQTIKTIASIK